MSEYYIFLITIEMLEENIKKIKLTSISIPSLFKNRSSGVAPAICLNSTLWLVKVKK